jgi:exodeoxyribonuclease VII small subunit
MEKENKTYDQAIQRIEQIVNQLEQSTALSMEAYQALAKEAKQLLTFCQDQLMDWEKKMNYVIHN